MALTPATIEIGKKYKSNMTGAVVIGIGGKYGERKQTKRLILLECPAHSFDQTGQPIQPPSMCKEGYWASFEPIEV